MTTLHQAQAALQELVSAALAGLVTEEKETVTLGGTATVGDTVTLTLTSAGIGGSPVSVAYTVKAHDVLLNVCQGLARAFNANAAIRAAGLQAIASSSTPNVFVYYGAGLVVTWAFSLSGGATETVSLANMQVVPEVGVGWPPLAAIQEVARGGAALVTVFDRKVGRNVMRWSPYAYDQVTVAAALTTAVAPASGTVAPSGTCTITLGGAPNPGDAVSCVVTNHALVNSLTEIVGPTMAAQVVSAVGGDTASTMATKLAAAINADTTLRTWISAASWRRSCSPRVSGSAATDRRSIWSPLFSLRPSARWQSRSGPT